VQDVLVSPSVPPTDITSGELVPRQVGFIERSPIGSQGRGALDLFGIPICTAVDGVTTYLTGTLSKALGGFGGLVPGPAEWLAAVRGKSNLWAGATAIPAPMAAASRRALELAGQPTLREALARNVTRVRAGIRHLGIDVADLPTPIVGFTTGSAASMQKLAGALWDEGVVVPYARSYPGVGPEGAFRLAVFATHGDEHISELLDALRRHA
jgi:7-keto-8-aminopelargonate synthetase-like enzyme